MGRRGAGLSAVVVDYTLEGESLGDNDIHCSLGLGSGSLRDDSLAGMKKGETEREASREGRRVLAVLKVGSEKKRGCERPYG